MLGRSLAEPPSYLGPLLSTDPRAYAQEQAEVADACPWTGQRRVCAFQAALSHRDPTESERTRLHRIALTSNLTSQTSALGFPIWLLLGQNSTLLKSSAGTHRTQLQTCPFYGGDGGGDHQRRRRRGVPICGSPLHLPPQGQRELPASPPGALGQPGPQDDGKAPPLSAKPDSVSAVLFPFPPVAAGLQPGPRVNHRHF